MPYSGIYPYYAQHVMGGIFCAATKMGFSHADFSFVPVYVGQGGIKTTLEAVQKLLFFDGVDVLTGMVNIRVLEELRPMLENHQKVGLFFDFGELVPPKHGFGQFTHSISMNLWQAQYALGKWAVQEFGTDGQIISPFYESGFNLHLAFLHGAAAAGATELKNFVLPEAYANKDILNLQPFFDAIAKDPPAFVHAIFTGKMGNQFLEQWRNSKFYDHIPLLTVENMAYTDMLQDLQHLGIKLHTTSSWQRKSESLMNREFVKHFENEGKQEANIFGMLGYELGLALSTMMPYLRKGDTLAALHFLKQQKVEGPRGVLNIQESTPNQFPLVDITQVNTNKNTINQTIVSQSTAIGFDTTTVFQETVSGWQNPYLSV